jgi:hypothetical protein
MNPIWKEKSALFVNNKSVKMTNLKGLFVSSGTKRSPHDELSLC